MGIDLAPDLARTALEGLSLGQEEIRRAFMVGDGKALAWAAHTLGGSAALLDEEMQAAAEAVEASARVGHWVVVPGQLARLESALARVCAELSAFVAGRGPA